jgi:hypothetical protein
VKETAPADATETVKGIVELASAAETATGTDGTRAVTPAGLKGELDKKIDDAPNGTVDGTVQYARQVVRAAGVNTKTWAPVDYSKAVAKAGDTMTGNLTVPSLNGGQLAGFRNVLINGAMLINQRANSNLSNHGQYCPDRWYNTGTSVLGLNKLTTAGFVGAGLQPVSGTGIVRQAIELPKASNLGGNVSDPYNPFVVGSKWTLSVYADNASPTFSDNQFIFADDAIGTNSTPGPFATTSTGWVSVGNGRWSNTYTFIAAPQASHNCLVVQLTWAAGRIGGVQLEPGPVATPFEHRPIGVELQLCQRYFQQLAILGTAFSPTNADAGNLDAYCPIHITPMRSFNATVTPGTISVGGTIGVIGANLTIKDVQYADKATARLRMAKIGTTASVDVVSKIGSGVDLLALDCEL